MDVIQSIPNLDWLSVWIKAYAFIHAGDNQRAINTIWWVCSCKRHILVLETRKVLTVNTQIQLEPYKPRIRLKLGCTTVHVHIKYSFFLSDRLINWCVVISLALSQLSGEEVSFTGQRGSPGEPGRCLLQGRWHQERHPQIWTSPDAGPVSHQRCAVGQTFVLFYSVFLQSLIDQ